MLLWLAIVTRILANPVSNVFQKRLVQRSAHPLFIIAATHALLACACVPLLCGSLELATPPSFWGNIMFSVMLAVVGNAVLVAALGVSDLSVLGPINAYKSVLSLLLGMVLVNEFPSALGVLGVLLIVAGSYFVVDRPAGKPRHMAYVHFLRDRGIQLRFLALVLSATEAVFLKRAILDSTPLTTFVFWCLLGLPVAGLGSALLLHGRVVRELNIFRREWSTYVWLAVTTGLMQLTTLLTFGKLPVGYALALFQLSTILSVFLGYRFFQEQKIGRRLVGSLVMVSGAVLIIVFGRSA